MAKKKSKGKKKPPAAKAAESEVVDAECDDDGDETAADPAVAETPAPAPKAARAAKSGPPSRDPNLPRADGENVSQNGGLVFVGVVLSLIVAAIVAQFIMGG